MREDSPSRSREGPQKQLPQDASVYAELKSWILYISKTDRSLIIDTTDYHPGLLHMTREDLQKILEIL
jgi:hypothetical protein